MDSNVISALIGAALGSLTSVTTLFVQNFFQNRRDFQRLLYETAYKDYELRVVHSAENRGPFPVILAYHQKMLELVKAECLTPNAAKEVMKVQGEMFMAVKE